MREICYNQVRTRLSLEKDAPISCAPSIAPGTFSAAPSSADCTTNMFGFDLR
jgi:hypothetical protein